MRKTITTLLILFLTLGLFAETGYAGTEWGTPKSWLRFDDEIEDYGIKNKIMLGENTKVFYSFYNNKLEGLSYSISSKKTNELLKKYKKENKLGTVQVMQITQEMAYEVLEPEEQNEKWYEIFLHAYCYNKSIECDVILANNYKTEGKCTIHIYNYNDDTRVYIFENLVEGKTFIYYTFREQDY